MYTVNQQKHKKICKTAIFYKKNLNLKFLTVK
jgi:hypothetical protein